MPAPFTDPYGQLALILKTVLDTEFADLEIDAQHDNLHESLGIGKRAVGIAPMRDVPVDRNAVAQHTYAEVKFFDRWDPKIDPGQKVDPREITQKAERFRDALRRTRATDPGTGEVWFFEILSVEYPNDPTGNKTRFSARVRAWGNNGGLIETQA